MQRWELFNDDSSFVHHAEAPLSSFLLPRRADLHNTSTVTLERRGSPTSQFDTPLILVMSVKFCNRATPEVPCSSPGLWKLFSHYRNF
jgi:hypothetical protein